MREEEDTMPRTHTDFTPLDETTAHAALSRLSELMDEHCPTQSIEVRAVGGYAMVMHGLRGSGGMTLDIDTATPTYSPEVTRQMHAVADEMGLERDWLNNDCVFTMGDEVTDDDVDYFDQMLDATYKPESDYGNVTVSIADEPTLARAKAFAVSDETCGVGGGRDAHKDLNDLVSLVRDMGAETYDDAMSLNPWMEEPEFSGCLKSVRKAFDRIERTGARGVPEQPTQLPDDATMTLA